VTRRINNVDLMLFQLVVIAVILAPALVPSSRLQLFLVDFANFVNDARVKQDALSCCCLARINVGRNPDIAYFF